jgi:hypothetical protein
LLDNSSYRRVFVFHSSIDNKRPQELINMSRAYPKKNNVSVTGPILPDPQRNTYKRANFGPVLEISPMPNPMSTHVNQNGCETTAKHFVQPGVSFIAPGGYAVGTNRMALSAATPFGPTQRYAQAILAASQGCRR